MDEYECKSMYDKRSNNGITEEEERQHFHRIVAAFKYYRYHALERVENTISYLCSIPIHHQKLLKNYRDDLSNIKNCIENNSFVINLIIEDVANIFANDNNINPGLSKNIMAQRPLAADMEKVQVTLKQFVRDWSDAGAEERRKCYHPIIDEVVKLFPPEDFVPQNVKVLVPGAGLGRLAFEIARRGYTCQGNEFSLFMLFASNFVLNKCNTVNKYLIHPWVHQYVNNLSPEHQIKGITFPDINPMQLPEDAEFSMTAGDFLEVYKKPEEWNCVTTCFFIDCAHNVVAFIEAIYYILKPGGYWINMGPLLYHFADLQGENSIEPSYVTIREVITGIGFEVKKEDRNVRTSYAQNPESMLHFEYRSVFFVCRKPGEDPTEPETAGPRC